MLTIQIASDLHIESYDGHPEPKYFITPKADILILAGDIGSLYKYEQLETFLTKLSKMFKLILYVPGNHEFYTIKGYKPMYINNLYRRLYNLEIAITNLTIMNMRYITIENYNFIGATLWSNAMVDIPTFLLRIHGLTKEMYQHFYRRNVAYLSNIIPFCNRGGKRTVVMTHYSPSYSLIPDVMKLNKYISLYTSDLDELVLKSDFWISGHTNVNYDTLIKHDKRTTRLISNQKGKPKDELKRKSQDYDDKLVITLI